MIAAILSVFAMCTLLGFIRMTNAGQLAFMNNALISADDGNFLGSKLHLWTAYDGADPPIVASFTEATYHTYAAITPTWAPRVMPDQSAGFSSINSFTPTDDVVPNTIRGWFLTDSGGTVLLAWDTLDAPVDLLDVDNTLNLAIDVVVPSGTNWGQSVVS